MNLAETITALREVLAPWLGQYVQADGSHPKPAVTSSLDTPPGYRMKEGYSGRLELVVLPTPRGAMYTGFDGQAMLSSLLVFLRMWPDPAAVPGSETLSIRPPIDAILTRFTATQQPVILDATETSPLQATLYLEGR